MKDYTNLINEIDDWKLSCYPPHYPVIKVWNFINENEIKKIQNKLKNYLKSSRIKTGLYINIPFCKTKCKFCYLKVYTSKTILDKFIQTLIKEMEIYSGYKINIDSIYIAGGTVTIPEVKKLEFIFEGLKKNFNLNKIRQITIETSPSFLDEERIKILKKNGVNLIMLGVQSFNDDISKNENRYQKKNDIYKAINLLKKYKIAFNIDLIVGLSDPKTFISDVYHLIKTKPDLIHLNKIKPTRDINHKIEIEKLQKKGLEILRENGYKIIDEESASLNGIINIQGDMNYQNNSNIIGIGPGALTHIYSKIRYSTYFEIEKYFKLIDKGIIPIEKYIKLSEIDEADFYILSKIYDGIKKNELKRKFPQSFKIIQMRLKKLIQKSAVIIKKGKYYLNKENISVWYEITKTFYEKKYLRKLIFYKRHSSKREKEDF
jgi:oxygen-independent coproporphyrinogen-3 oxidase